MSRALRLPAFHCWKNLPADSLALPGSPADRQLSIRHDAQNLKLLFKARILETEAEGLSGCGTIPVDTMAHAVMERDMSSFLTVQARDG